MMWKHALRGILGASVAVALASGIAFAKDKEKGKEAGAPKMDADTQAMMAEMAKYAEPGPEHKVLRGGAWATRTAVIRRSFRNWDLPERRQIFAGFRCARDA